MGDSTGDAMAMIQAGGRFWRAPRLLPQASPTPQRNRPEAIAVKPGQSVANIRRRPKGCPYIRIINQQQFHWDPIGFRKNAGVWEDLLCEVRTIQWYQDFRMHLPRLSSSRPQGARMIKTGSPEWRTTVSVILPNVHPFTPDHPCVHMAIRLSGVLRPNEII
jgi:hypothetical protein